MTDSMIHTGEKYLDIPSLVVYTIQMTVIGPKEE